MFKTLIPTKFAFEMILNGKNWDAEEIDGRRADQSRGAARAATRREAWKWGEETDASTNDVEILQDGRACFDGSRQCPGSSRDRVVDAGARLVNPRAYRGDKGVS
jgi:hypothetical protein